MCTHYYYWKKKKFKMKINEKFWIQIFMLGFGIRVRMPKVYLRIIDSNGTSIGCFNWAFNASTCICNSRQFLQLVSIAARRLISSMANRFSTPFTLNDTVSNFDNRWSSSSKLIPTSFAVPCPSNQRFIVLQSETQIYRLCRLMPPWLNFGFH